MANHTVLQHGCRTFVKVSVSVEWGNVRIRPVEAWDRQAWVRLTGKSTVTDTLLEAASLFGIEFICGYCDKPVLIGDQSKTYGYIMDDIADLHEHH